MSEYKLTNNPNIVVRTSDGASIPNDLTNMDYLEYTLWVTDGGIPDPADQPSARDIAMAEIATLEASITDRMWREDAVGSAAVMTFSPDDPRTGKTATQYIAYVNSTIANIRAGL
jgi:hypothetical protein